VDLQNSFTAGKTSKFPTKPIIGYTPHLEYVTALPWKTLKSEICNSHARKHVSIGIFCHLSNRYLPNVMKVNGKINTMQNTNILLFVRSLSLTY